MLDSINLTSPFELIGSTTATTVDAQTYRGAVITSSVRATEFSFTLEGFPLIGWTGLKSLAATAELVDAWLDYGQMLTPAAATRPCRTSSARS